MIALMEPAQVVEIQVEEWQAIPGYEGIYEISNTGRISALVKHKGLLAGRMKKISQHKSGYMYVGLSKGGKRKRYYLHRLMMLAFCPIENSDDLDVNHIDGNKQNCALDNLEWCTHQQNIQHAHDVLEIEFGVQGEASPNAKLSEDDVREIRQFSAKGMQQKIIALMFGVSQARISMIVHRKAWAHVS